MTSLCYYDYLDCAQLCVAGNLTTCNVEEYFTAKCQLCDEGPSRENVQWDHQNNHELILEIDEKVLENVTYADHGECEPGCWSEYCSIYRPQQIALDVLPQHDILEAVGMTDEYCHNGLYRQY